MDLELECKLGELIHHLLEVKGGRTAEDKQMVHYYLVDPQIANWADRLNKAGMVKTRFARRDPR